jgi:hypothetical protein
MEKENEKTVTVKFTVAAFRYNGKVYKSAAVEKAAEDGDVEAQAIVANLVAIGSGVVSVVDETSAPAAKAPKAAKKAIAKAKAAKSQKTPKTPAKPQEAEAPKASEGDTSEEGDPE